MFDNIGSKLKSMAVVFCMIGVAGSVITMLVMSASGNALFGLFYGVLGSLASWLGSWATYGLGEAAEKSQANYEESKALSEELKAARSELNMLREEVKVFRAEAAAKSREKASAVPGAEAATPQDPSVPEQQQEAPQEAIRPRIYADDEDPSWDKPEPGFVNCPRCGKHMSVDFVKTRKKCPNCGRPYVPANQEE